MFAQTLIQKRAQKPEVPTPKQTAHTTEYVCGNSPRSLASHYCYYGMGSAHPPETIRIKSDNVTPPRSTSPATELPGRSLCTFKESPFLMQLLSAERYGREMSRGASFAPSAPFPC